MLIKAISRYLEDKNPARLNAILISNKLKATKSNIEAFKVLLTDYEKDQDINPIKGFLGLEIKNELEPIQLEEIEPNEDDFVITVKQAFGDPADPQSLGNKILRQEIIRFNIRSYINPDILFNKFCALAGKTSLLIEHHPVSLQGIPTHECILAGYGSLDRTRKHKID